MTSHPTTLIHNSATMGANPHASGSTTTVAGGPMLVAEPPWWGHWLRSAVFVLLLCLGIAALLTVMYGSGFGYNLVHSLAIGACSWFCIDGGRHAVAFGINRFRAARRQAPLTTGGYPGWRWMVPLVLLAVAVAPVVGNLIASAILGKPRPSLFLFSSSSSQVTIVLTVLASVASVVILGTMQRLAKARAEAEAARRAAAENQLKLLESQLEPHMLFNTLANLRVLIALDPPRAQAMLDQLIGFLRATLGASRVGQHPLAAEFARLSDYLSLMQVRMGNRLETRIDLPADLAECPVPPLLLQPLVENAIKHGLEPEVEGGLIQVSAARAGGQLVLQVRDTGVGLSRAGAAGTDGMRFGLAQVRERLATLYGERASLELGDAPNPEGGTLATVRLPLDPN